MITTDFTELNKFEKKLKELTTKSAKVGFFSEQVHPNGETLANIAFVNNEGVNLPRRPFFNFAIQLSERHIARKMIKGFKNFLNKGKSVDTALRPAANAEKMLVKQMIQTSSQYIPNAPSTVARKGKNTPLTDTGYLGNHVKVKIENRD